MKVSSIFLLMLLFCFGSLYFVMEYANIYLYPTSDGSDWNWAVFPIMNDDHSTNLNSMDKKLQDIKPLKMQGIVMCSGNDAVMRSNVAYTLETIRVKYNSSIHITIAHCGELSRNYQQHLIRTYSELAVQDLCKHRTSYAQRKKLRGWFCKPAALVRSSYEETMLVDIDTIWFDNPVALFQVDGYQRTGGLFFRDRLYYDQPECKLKLPYIIDFIDKHSYSQRGTFKSYLFQNNSMIESLVDGSYSTKRETKIPDVFKYSYYWRALRKQGSFQPLCHLQESSVVIINKSKLPRTVELMKAILPSFSIGHGDKELYWMAATASGEPFAWEPFISGTYGDCGVVLHYDPLWPQRNGFPSSVSSTSVRNPKESKVEHVYPYFMNGEYLVEDVGKLGQYLGTEISNPVLAIESQGSFSLGEFNSKTGGRCGACRAMGGCQATPDFINEEILRVQLHHLRTIGFSWGLQYPWFRRIRKKFRKILRRLTY